MNEIILTETVWVMMRLDYFMFGIIIGAALQYSLVSLIGRWKKRK